MTNSSNLGFEKQLWETADALRGNLDASEYKSVILGLIFLKYISDRFEEDRLAAAFGRCERCAKLLLPTPSRFVLSWRRQWRP